METLTEKFPRSRKQRVDANWFWEQAMERKYGSDWLKKIPPDEFMEIFHCVMCGSPIIKANYEMRLFFDANQTITKMTCADCLDLPMRRNVSEHLLTDYN